jgi:ribonuclease-3
MIAGAPWNHADPHLDALADRLGHPFHDKDLLRQALTHGSASAAASGRQRSNERLEFLGDRVLGLAVAELLYKRFPNESEGALARRHASLVRRDALARVAEDIGLGRHVMLSRSEEEAGGRSNPALLADTCEAVIAALHLDGGWAVAAAFVSAAWLPLVEQDESPPTDAKTALQEWVQARGLPLPVYREIGRDGPAHAPRFVVEVSVAGLEPAMGDGSTKRTAERAAAVALLARIGDDGVR